MTSSQSATGRPRDQTIDDAVLTAVLTLLDQKGYPELTVGEVAQRAGTSRPSIYRRWSGRASLALAAIATRLDVPAPPDTGCTLCDFAESLEVFLCAYRTIRPDVLNALYAECALDEQLRERYLQTLVEPARAAVAATVDRAISRGHLVANADRDLILDFFASLTQYRAQFGQRHMSEAEAYGAIEMLLRGAAKDFDALVEHSRSVQSEPGVSHAHHADLGAESGPSGTE